MDQAFDDTVKRGQGAAARQDWPESERCFREARALAPHAENGLRGLGDALVSQQKWGEAEEVWRAAVALKPDRADAQQILGLVLMRRDDLDGARTHLTLALELNPGLPEAAFNLGRISYIDGDRGRAAEFFAHAHAHAPLHVKALAGLAQTLNELGREA